MVEQDEVVHRVTTKANGVRFSAELGSGGSVKRIDLIVGTAQVCLQASDLPLLVGFVARVVATRERLQAESAAAQPTDSGSDR